MAYDLIKGTGMTTISTTKARSNLYRLVDEVNSSHQPVIITGRKKQAVLVGEDDWRAIQETMHLLSVPGMRESIREGLETPIDQCGEGLDISGMDISGSGPIKVEINT